MRSGNIFVIGVTGPIGSGKSTFCKILQDKYGFVWIEADSIVHDLYKKGREGYEKIKDYFGPQFVGPKEVYRGRLRKLVLKTPQKLWILNKLMHSLITHEVNKKIDQLKKVHKGKDLKIAIEAIYFEAQDLGKFIDELVVLKSSYTKIVQRLFGRKLPQKDIETLYKMQMRVLPTIGAKGKIIENEGDREELAKKIEALYGSR